MILFGVKGSLTKIIETLDKLSSIRASYPKLDLVVGMTVTPENYREGIQDQVSDPVLLQTR